MKTMLFKVDGEWRIHDALFIVCRKLTLADICTSPIVVFDSSVMDNSVLPLEKIGETEYKSVMKMNLQSKKTDHQCEIHPTA